MIGVVGALVALAVVLALVLALAVRPPVRRLGRAVAVLRTDVTTRVAVLDALRREGRAARSGRHPSPSAGPSSPIGGAGRHRRTTPAP